MSEIRYDLLHNEYVIIAPERLHKPSNINCEKEKTHKECPFCPGKETLTTKEIFSIKQNGKWHTRVFPNLYKAVMIETPIHSEADSINEKWSGFGAHEIIIDTPRHIHTLNMSKEEINYWLLTIKQRVNDLQNDKRLNYISVFKNQGENAGASQSHPHTQIISLGITPINVKRYLTFAHEYFLKHGRSLFEDILNTEQNSERKILSTSDFLVYSPYASEFPFETVIISKTYGMENIEKLSDIIFRLFRSLYKELNLFDFNMLFYFAPLNKNFENELFFDDLKYFWKFHIKITPRLYKLAGFEMQSNMKINPVIPEIAAKLLRKDIDSD